MDWALHPDVVDPQYLLSKVQDVRSHREPVLHHRADEVDSDLDTIEHVLTSETDTPRARYRGTYSDRPPATMFLTPHPATSVFQSVVAHCAEPLCPEDDFGKQNPFEHWIDEIKDMFRRFGPCDPRWIKVRLHELLTFSQHAFVNPPATATDMADQVEIVLVGDWATALPQALNVAHAIGQRLQDGADIERHVIHLGDTYYCGLPEEYKHRFLPHWPVPVGSSVKSWSLNGNHDMYTGGHGYFDVLLKDPRFTGQQGSSNFLLRNQHWQIVGLDSAYPSPDKPGLTQGQQQWLTGAIAEAHSSSRQSILLTHHQAFTAYGDSSVSGQLAADVSQALHGSRVAAWFWGHEHRGTVYATDITAKNYDNLAGYTSTVGHGGVPQLLTIDGHAATTVEQDMLVAARGGWEFNGRYTVQEDTWALGGYAVLAFDRDHLEVSHFDELGQLRHGPTEIPAITG